MDYKYFRRRNPEWPKRMSDAVGRRVRLKCDTVTRGGTEFHEGEELFITSTWRGHLSLSNREEAPNNRSIRGVEPWSVQLLKPKSIIWRNREAFLIFCISVAGKQSVPTQNRVEKFLRVCCGKHGRPDTSPFSHIGDLLRTKGALLRELKRLKFGQYTKLVKAFTELAESDIDLKRCSPDELEWIHGVGPKTSRYFILRTRPNAKVAALDTHVLRWLRDIGHEKIPKSTPQSGRAYSRIESLFLEEARKRRTTPAKLDGAIWESYSQWNMTSSERDVADERASFD